MGGSHRLRSGRACIFLSDKPLSKTEPLGFLSKPQTSMPEEQKTPRLRPSGWKSLPQYGFFRYKNQGHGTREMNTPEWKIGNTSFVILHNPSPRHSAQHLRHPGLDPGSKKRNKLECRPKEEHQAWICAPMYSDPACKTFSVCAATWSVFLAFLRSQGNREDRLVRNDAGMSSRPPSRDPKRNNPELSSGLDSPVKPGNDGGKVQGDTGVSIPYDEET